MTAPTPATSDAALDSLVKRFATRLATGKPRSNPLSAGHSAGLGVGDAPAEAAPPELSDEEALDSQITSALRSMPRVPAPEPAAAPAPSRVPEGFYSDLARSFAGPAAAQSAAAVAKPAAAPAAWGGPERRAVPRTPAPVRAEAPPPKPRQRELPPQVRAAVATEARTAAGPARQAETVRPMPQLTSAAAHDTNDFRPDPIIAEPLPSPVDVWQEPATPAMAAVAETVVSPPVPPADPAPQATAAAEVAPPAPVAAVAPAMAAAPMAAMAPSQTPAPPTPPVEEDFDAVEHLAAMEARLTAAIASLAHQREHGGATACAIAPELAGVGASVASLAAGLGGIREDLQALAPVHGTIERINERLDSVGQQLVRVTDDEGVAARLGAIDARLAALEQMIASEIQSQQEASMPEQSLEENTAVERALAELTARIEELRNGLAPAAAAGQFSARAPVRAAASAAAVMAAAPSAEAPPHADGFAAMPGMQDIGFEPAGMQPEVAAASAAGQPGAAPLSREDLVASARRAAASGQRPPQPQAPGARRAPLVFDPNTPLPGPEVMTATAGRAAAAVRPGAQRAQGGMFSSPRMLLVISAVVLGCLCAGLIYGKVSAPRPADALTIERISSPKAGSKAPAAGDRPAQQIGPEGGQSLLDEKDFMTPDSAVPRPVPARPKSAVAAAEPSLGLTDPAETSTIAPPPASVVTDPIDDLILGPAADSASTLLPSPAAVDTQSGAESVTGSETKLGSAPRLDLPPAIVGPLAVRTAAANGDAQAQFEVGQRYADNKAKFRDNKQAIAWFERAAKQGHPVAQFRLGAAYERGLGVGRDVAQASDWYVRAADQGNVMAMHNLAVIKTGTEVGAPDYAQAAHWFGKAATFGLADSQFNLAVLYENGLGVEQTPAEAYRWYSLAAKGGDKEAEKRRTALRPQLPAKVADALDQATGAWKPQPSDRAANENKKQRTSALDGAAASPLGSGREAEAQTPSAKAPRVTVASLGSRTSVRKSGVTAEQASAADGAAPLAPAAEPETGVTSAQVQLVQQMLGRLGYDPGNEKGELTPKTRQAIRLFESRTGLPETGRLGADLVRRLSELAG